MTADDIDLDALLRLADAATPGAPLAVNPWFVARQLEDRNISPADAAFIAAADPATIKALVQRVRDAEASAEEKRQGYWSLDRMFQNACNQREKQRDRAVAAEARVTELEADNKQLKRTYLITTEALHASLNEADERHADLRAAITARCTCGAADEIL